MPRNEPEVLQSVWVIYRDHIAVEDCDLFPAAARLLSPDQMKDIGAEMAARRGLPPHRAGVRGGDPGLSPHRAGVCGGGPGVAGRHQ